MHRLAAALVASALVVAMLPSARAWAGPGDVSVLGLDAAKGDAAVANDLTAALRAELSSRGKGTSKELTLIELRLTMGCDEGDLTCLADGGKTLDASELVYGSVKSDADAYTIELTRLDVAAGSVTKTASRVVPKAELGAGERLAEVAAQLVDALYATSENPPVGGTPAVETTPEPTATDAGTPTAQPADVPATSKGSGLIWGRDPSPPTWKWIGLGVSGGLTLAALGAAVGTTVSTSRLEDDLRKAADDSLADDNLINDVDPALVADICDAARVQPDPMNEPGAVVNADIVTICNRGTANAKAATATWALTGVFAVSTAAFTTLLFVRRDDRASASLRRRGVSFGASPVRGGGVFVGGGFRF